MFADKGNSMLEDFYLQSLAANNIISNSSFSWWGAWLNMNPDKKCFIRARGSDRTILIMIHPIYVRIPGFLYLTELRFVIS